MIPEAAVEAALVAWGKWPEGVSAREQAARILEAAAPHILKSAYDLGFEHGSNEIPNPYRADETP